MFLLFRASLLCRVLIGSGRVNWSDAMATTANRRESGHASMSYPYVVAPCGACPKYVERSVEADLMELRRLHAFSFSCM